MQILHCVLKDKIAVIKDIESAPPFLIKVLLCVFLRE